MKAPTVGDMKVVPEFQAVPDDQLQWLINQGESAEVEKGDLLFNVGAPVNTCYIVLGGKMRICAVQSGAERELRILHPGQATGYLPYSRATVTPVFCEALEKTWVFRCTAAKLKTGTGDHYELYEAMVHMMLNRVREFTSIQQQNEKMFALGKLSAGLAHELNNPAAAISAVSTRRTASSWDCSGLPRMRSLWARVPSGKLLRHTCGCQNMSIPRRENTTRSIAGKT